MLFHKIDERSEMLVLFGSCGNEFDPQDLLQSLSEQSCFRHCCLVYGCHYLFCDLMVASFQLCGFGLCSCHSGRFIIQGTFLLACDIVVYSILEHLLCLRPFLTNVCLSSHQQFKVVRLYQMTRPTDGSVPSNVVMGEAIMTLLLGMTGNVSPKT